MIRVGVLGAGGRMGREACRAVSAAEDLELVAAVDPAHAGTALGDVVAGNVPAIRIEPEVDALARAGVQVAVDFTVAPAARAHLSWCAAHRVHAVVGTTGLGPGDLVAVTEELSGTGANAVIAPNFAIGAVLLERFCEMAAPFMEGVEIIELHHDRKRDAPSGTAMHTAERIADARRLAGSPALADDPTSLVTLPGARGGRTAGGVHVHAVRLPGLVAHEEVVFGAEGQSLTLRHDSYDRVSFMAGVLLAVRCVTSRPGVTIGLDSVLGF